MKKQIKAIISLFSICAIAAILLALTNYFTLPIIKENDSKKANEALLIVLPNGEDFKKVDLSKYELPATVTEAYTEKNGGCVIKLETTGYASGMVIMCGINADGTVSGSTCLSSGETLGYEKTYGDNFKGLNKDNVLDVATVSGATKTTSAYKNAIKDAINASIIIGGGSVDIRTEEEIFAEKLATALPSAEGKFTKLFIAEVISDVISSVYVAENKSGSVYVCGESFIAVDKDGAVTTQTTDELKEAVESAAKILAAHSSSELDLADYGDIPSAVTKAEKTASGNYILTLRAAGYGINGGDKWHPASGEYIVIKLSISAEGKIINCLTVSEGETDGVGDICADSKYYSQFDGKTEGTYTEVDTVTGATMTTSGYMKAIENAFKAFKIINGGAGNE